jgi:hypothetical protein
MKRDAYSGVAIIDPCVSTRSEKSLKSPPPIFRHIDRSKAIKIIKSEVTTPEKCVEKINGKAKMRRSLFLIW